MRFCLGLGLISLVILGYSPCRLATAQVDFIATRMIDAQIQAIDLGDVDGDGHVDAVAVEPGIIRVMRNDGLDRFVSASEILVPNGHDVTAIRVIDQDGDELLDIVATTYHHPSRFSSLLVYYGRGDGTFEASDQIELEERPLSLDVADIDLKGALDVVIGTEQGVRHYPATGPRSFGSRVVTGGDVPLDQVAVADVTADGIPDLLVSSSEAGIFQYYPAVNPGAFLTDLLLPGTNTAFGRVRLADFDLDGHVDILGWCSAGYQDHGFELWRGLGGAHFASPVWTSIGRAAGYLQVGDLDGDGFPDLVGADSGQDRIHVFLSVPEHATFVLADMEPIEDLPDDGMALGDVDEDGDLDVLALRRPNGSNGDLLVFLNDGNGDLTHQSTLALSGGATLVQVGDFNEDGHLDAMVVVYGNQLTMLAGDGTGSFGAPTTVFQIHFPTGAFCVADFDGDSHLDLAIVDQIPEEVLIVLGDGLGGFVEAAALPAGEVDLYSEIVAADFDNDGNVDLALTSDLDGIRHGVRIFLGDGAGGFEIHDHVTSRELAEPGVADLDRDGNVDLVVAQRGNPLVDGLELLLGAGDGTFGFRSLQRLPTSSLGFDLTDLDRDGVLDVVLGEEQIRWLRGRQEGGFDSPGALPVHAFAGHPEVVDFDGDGNLDIVQSRKKGEGPAVTQIALGDGNLGFPEAHTHEHEWNGARRPFVADVTNDGKQDILIASYTDVGIFPGNGSGGGRLGQRIEYAGSTATDLEVADVTGDGNADLVTVAPPDKLSIWPGDGTGGFADVIELTLSSIPRSMVLGYIDDDSLLDAAVALTSGKVDILLGTAGTLTRVATVPAAGLLDEIVAADLDADGNLDLAVTSTGPDEVAVLYGAGNGSFVHGGATAVELPEGIVAGNFHDLDGSGTIDLCVVSSVWSDPRLVCLRNDGNRAFVLAAATSTSKMNSGEHLIAFDVDEDGHLDVGFATRTRLDFYLGDGVGSFPSVESLSFDSWSPGFWWCHGIRRGDLDGDGKLDLLAVDRGRGFAAKLGVGGLDYPLDLFFDGPFRFQTGDVALGDLDNNGLLDVVVLAHSEIGVHLNRTDRAIRCRAGSVNTRRFAATADVLLVNGSNGTTTTRELTLDGTQSMTVELLTAPVPSLSSRYHVGIWAGLPTRATSGPLPRGIGFACFTPLRMDPAYVMPLHVANTLLPDDARIDPSGPYSTGGTVPGVVLDIPGGLFAPGDRITVQGLLGDGHGRATKRVSTSNAVVVTFQ